MFSDGVRVKPKVGHAGTLDPLATGLLVICTGKRTKSISQIQMLSKEYTGTIVLGATTPSFDLETEIDTVYDLSHVSEAMVHDAAAKMIGKHMQVAPNHSARKVNGKRAYELARKGHSFELEPREVTIHEFDVTQVCLPEISFRISCTKGTYIRSVARDFGISLASGAYLSSLRRTKIGEYSIEDALDPATFQESLKS